MSPWYRFVAHRQARILRANQLTGWRRFYHRSRPFLAVVALSYLCLLAFPGFLFAYSASHGSYQVYSDAPIDPALSELLDRSTSRLARSSINDSSMVHRIYICNRPLLRRLLAPMTSSAFGSTYSWIMRRNTVLNRAEIPVNRIFSDAPTSNRRPLDSVIVHERVHALLGHHFGDVRAWLLPEWKVEGYCEMIAGGPSFDVKEGKRLLRAGLTHPSNAFRYFRYGLMVRYLIEIQGVEFETLMNQSFDTEVILDHVKNHLDRL